MPKRNHVTSTFAAPSPGQILRNQQCNGRPQRSTTRHAAGAMPVAPAEATTETAPAPATAAVDVPCDPFRPNGYGDALGQRGVMLAPLLVRWHYRIAAATSFAQWLKTHEIILADARLAVTQETVGVHYFGTYIAQPPAGRDVVANGVSVDAGAPVTASVAAARTAETFWGFSSEAALTHFYDLCYGRVARLSIVDQDLRAFIEGLKTHIHATGDAHFCQTVLLAPAMH